ncbi:unnamed protein product [Symbiodinium necroappetens]|uniref:Uncharacterized protein n=1 Tax=Symbiodinium necroappetens TaxID=1628268 RepID=A0A812YZ24_9DINO|nr:unnamed protein product [Symbiodinium necroappetens]
MAQLDALKPVDGLEAQRSETLAWLTTEHEVEMQAFVHQHLLSMLSPFSQRLKDLQDEIEACRDDLNRKAEQLKHTDTVVKQHGQELMTLTMDVNQAHAAVGGLRQELLPERSKKIDEHKVEDEFVEVRQKLKRLQTDLSSNQEVQARVDAELRDLQAIQRKTSSAVAEVTGELHGLRESNDFLSHCYSGISGRVEQAKRVADDTQSAFSKFQHTATNQLEDLKKNGLPQLSSRIDSLEAKQRTLAKEAQADVESLAQVKLQVAHLTTALASLDESVQEGQRVDTAQTSLVHEESINRRGKLERINTKVDETKAELTELAQTLHSDLSRRINDLAVLLDTKSHTIRSNTAAIRTVESGLNALGSDVRSSTAKIGEQAIVQERLVEQARVAETEIHSLFDFRKEAMTKLQDVYVVFTDRLVFAPESFFESRRWRVSLAQHGGYQFPFPWPPGSRQTIQVPRQAHIKCDGPMSAEMRRQFASGLALRNFAQPVFVKTFTRPMEDSKSEGVLETEGEGQAARCMDDCASLRGFELGSAVLRTAPALWQPRRGAGDFPCPVVCSDDNSSHRQFCRRSFPSSAELA